MTEFPFLPLNQVAATNRSNIHSRHNVLLIHTPGDRFVVIEVLGYQKVGKAERIVLPFNHAAGMISERENSNSKTGFSNFRRDFYKRGMNL